MTGQAATSRGEIWFAALTGQSGRAAGVPASVRVADADIGGRKARFLAVVPDPESRFPRARHGEVGLEQGWTLAQLVRQVIEADQAGVKRPIIAIVDVPSQAYGRREELMGIHLACAAAVDAYASARLAGHPVVALLVGRAMSGAFLAHGYQANRIVALDDPEVLVHAMGKAAAARITKRSVAELETLGETVLPMSYAIGNVARLGILHALVGGVNADAPDADHIARIRTVLDQAVTDALAGPRDLCNRLAAANSVRTASREVRRRMAEAWADD
jgi:malonate decarboxylase gamma subunit